MVDGAKDTIKVHDAVKEIPRDVALKGSQERVGTHDVVTRRPADVHEELVSTEGELAERELVVTLGIRTLGLHNLNV